MLSRCIFSKLQFSILSFLANQREGTCLPIPQPGSTTKYFFKFPEVNFFSIKIILFTTLNLDQPTPTKDFQNRN